MSLTIASIPGAAKILEDIEQLAAKRGRQQAFARFFEPFPPQRTKTSAKYVCNIVFQGGGVLGLAHVGFLAGLERAGIRIAGVAGTSAGAIVATSLVCARRTRIKTEVAEILLDLISTMPMSSFIDGPFRIRRLIKRILNLGKRALMNPSTWLEARYVIPRMLGPRGLNPGDEFEDWLRQAFAKLGVPDNDTLQRELTTVAGYLKRNLKVTDKPVHRNKGGVAVAQRRGGAEKDYLLKVIATALPPGLKFTFPADISLLAGKYQWASPATFVRASMAIPGFFVPKRLETSPTRWPEAVEKRLGGLVAAEQLAQIGRHSELLFVDGGLLSNVPVDAFERMLVPSLKGSGTRSFPTIIATLVNWRATRATARRRSWAGLFQDVMGLAQAVRLQRDRDALRRLLSSGNEDARIVEIDTTGFNWLNFTMSQDEMGRLFVQGLERARKFLEDLK